jgi:hypothetical protein
MTARLAAPSTRLFELAGDTATSPAYLSASIGPYRAHSAARTVPDAGNPRQESKSCPRSSPVHHIRRSVRVGRTASSQRRCWPTGASRARVTRHWPCGPARDTAKGTRASPASDTRTSSASGSWRSPASDTRTGSDRAERTTSGMVPAFLMPSPSVANRPPAGRQPGPDRRGRAGQER